MTWSNKDPDDIADYAIDWSRVLGTDTISASQWIVPSGLTEGASSFTATTATVWLSAGTADANYSVTNRITTAAGRQFDRSVSLFVTQR